MSEGADINALVTAHKRTGSSKSEPGQPAAGDSKTEHGADPAAKASPGPKAWGDIPGMDSGTPESESGDQDPKKEQEPSSGSKSSGGDPKRDRIHTTIKTILNGFDFINGLVVTRMTGSSPDKMEDWRASDPQKDELVNYATDAAIEEGWADIRISPLWLIAFIMLTIYGPIWYAAWEMVQERRKAAKEKAAKEGKKKEEQPPQAPPPQQQSPAPKEEIVVDMNEDQDNPGTFIESTAEAPRKKTRRGRKRAPMVTSQCEECGNDFEHKANKPRKFCDQSCSGKAGAKRNNKKTNAAA